MTRMRIAVLCLALLAAPALAQETIRVGLPTKTYWPTTVAETAVRQKLFEKEGIKAELTIYRSGAETFEGMAAGAADIILDPPSLVSADAATWPDRRLDGAMSRGFGLMPSYARVLPERDRRGVIAYVRALQRSQRSVLAELPPRLQDEARPWLR